MGTEDKKIMVDENQGVAALLGSLDRIDAPNDFDFHVRARIAKGKPAARTGSLFPLWAKLAVPALLLSLIGGYFTLRMSSPGDAMADVQTIAPAPVVNPNADTARVEADAAFVAQSIEGPTAAKPSVTVNRAIERDPAKRKSVANTSGRPGDGSYVEAGRETRVLTPAVPAQAILSQLGTSGGFEGSHWKVASVSPNSIADHSGVKAGDIIEAINGQPLVEKTSFPNKFNGRSLLVRRDGKTLQIDLRH